MKFKNVLSIFPGGRHSLEENHGCGNRGFDSDKNHGDQRKTSERKIGLAKGDFVVTDAFFDPLPDEVLRAFNGGEIVKK